MKEIIGDDYPTYEDSVKMTLAERKQDGMYLDENNTWRMKCGCSEANALDNNHNVCKDSYTYMTEVEHKIFKSEAERLKLENLQLRHRLACIKDDIEIIDRHIQNNCNKKFKKSSLNADGSIYADEAWHNITNIEIACDLSDESVDEWGSDLAEEYRNKINEKKC
jgi:hypothetical protein